MLIVGRMFLNRQVCKEHFDYLMQSERNDGLRKLLEGNGEIFVVWKEKVSEMNGILVV